ncbi:MAG TPA: 4Fe-4S dicluster domain-containing protein [Vicinamibacteria bacterium]|nr:4Fe-4S dicluster domain-containing protein [Vicinamibacteria bacterium]
MAIRVNPMLVSELEKYGAEDVQNCYHCGNCSAVCAHSDEMWVFPRKPMRLLQMGLEERLRRSLDPWLCYYCGQCSAQCPRGAEPGETMMSLRRWLTSRYDVTGISRLFYRSWKAELAALVLLALATAAGFLSYGFGHGRLSVYDGPGALLPSSAVHFFDWTMAGVLTLLLAANAARMWWLTTGGNPRIRVGLGSYLRRLHVLPLHFFTQRRYARCEKPLPWLVHLGLVFSYLTLFGLIMFFLREMQAGPAVRWAVHAPGYLASAGLLGAVVWAIRGRLRRSEPQFSHSHESDWIFLAMLLLVGATGVVQHVLHRLGSPQAANLAYVLHLSFVVPMLLLEVPFSKWSHLAYRPLAMYLAEVRRDAHARGNRPKPAEAPVRRAA